MMTTISSYSTNYKGTEAKQSSLRTHKQWRVERLVLRLAVAALFFVLLFTGMTLMKSFANSEQPAAAGAGERVIIVSSGDTLWNIANDIRDSGQDVRRVVYDLKVRNNLTSSTLQAGQTLIIPAD
ncbi:LysM peptidoglycan-binding domain-containing protein [Paenibacillus solisilvae]|uniref:LysM peptidoglycan-binding domain-containing protein n=1 Tax=Paenibacillus solisilvae TaxID=2486751 RepID=A0ABW0VTW9_9BACL